MKTIFYLIFLSTISDVKFYQNVIIGLLVAIAILFIAIFIMRKKIVKLKSDQSPEPRESEPEIEQPAITHTPLKPQPPKMNSGVGVSPKELPDPGLVYKYSLADENILEKLITVGQTEGSIKTYSTEIINHHLSIFIRIIENQRSKDIYNLPSQIVEEYMIDLRRDGKVLYFHEGMEGFKPMPSKLRIYLKPEPDEMGDPTFADLPAQKPIRFRLGDRLNAEDKFINGFFEFHLFTKDYTVKTTAGIPKIEKNFFVRLFKIYPGYDTGARNSDGLYPMVDPFTAKK